MPNFIDLDGDIGTLGQEVAFPRVSSKMKVAELREEAIVRWHDKLTIPKMKTDFLDLLVTGTIYIRGTQAWEEIEMLLARVEMEKEELREVAAAKAR
ncbi:hypothetical protein SARC_04250 [Sphaeroforma arctica JP610]|uniref:Uncharacterized protein n=1 Tax=Sphaeroforma arctica JP610 TaxID=667725 RepID=A0A0L0G2Y4_9EUKA|nr:hypothetical protein SARC_04250 [Sphaeroforma arctica JP610]KNC83492.1 hypothetical protein SARC_04250 [Sphaeroforma arctica JP610]|eukprot:XP_014157394.1 hypothetical protein SARC_04250 [Sphaeroforma arctica JP610]